MKQSPLRLLAFMFAASGVLAVGTHADAALIMTIDDGGGPIVIMDNGIGDTNASVGVITFADPTAGIAMNSITGFGIQGPNSAVLDVLAFHSAFPGGAGGSLTITLSQDGFVLPAAGNATISSAVGGTTSIAGTLSSNVQLDTSNLLPYVAGPTTSLGPLSGLVFGDSVSVGFAYAGAPFSMTRTIEITIGENETMSYNSFAEVAVFPEAVVPEPATMAYLGLSLGALGLRRRRRSAA